MLTNPFFHYRRRLCVNLRRRVPPPSSAFFFFFFGDNELFDLRDAEPRRFRLELAAAEAVGEDAAVAVSVNRIISRGCDCNDD